VAYTVKNFKTKKELKEAIKNGEKIEIATSQFGPPVVNGRVSLEGPHYPEPHMWYAIAKVENGFVVKIT